MSIPHSHRRRLTAAGLGAVLMLAAACEDDPAEPIPGGGDPENISRVTVTLTPQGGGTAQSSVVIDPDGTGGPQPPSAPSATLALSRGVTYDGDIQIANDLDPSNVVDIDEEVREEANFHRLVHTFTCAPDVDAPVESYDTDTQEPPQPLGLTFDVVVAADAAVTSDCIMNVELRHFESDKGDGLGSNYETDLDLDFPVSVQ
ncbi:MAG: hypothetical protein ACREMZ_09770 [Gemmatimonadales bacterium]